MYCLTDICYVCLKNNKPLINISSSSVNKDIIHIISCLPINFDWLKTKQIILICEECCLRLRGTYQFLAMCLKNSAMMQGYMEKMNTESISKTNNEAELRINLNKIQDDINEPICDIKLENEEIYIFECEPIIEETVETYINVEESIVKEEDAWMTEEVYVEEESPIDNNFIENNDNEMDSEICVNNDTHDTGNIVIEQSVAMPEYKTSTVVGTIGEQNFSDQCKVCSITVPTRELLNCHITDAEHVTKLFCKYCKQSVNIEQFDPHIKQHENEDVFCCECCGEMIYKVNAFIRHSRIHRRHKCKLCPMQFDSKLLLNQHLKVHTGAMRNRCKYCNRKFKRFCSLITHLAARTCQK